MTRAIALNVAFAFAGSLGVTAANAHHSYTEFDQARTVEIEGTLLVAQWQNPHTQLQVRDSSDPDTVWNVQTAPINSLRRQGASIDAFEVGDTVKIAGWPSKRAGNRIYGTNMVGDGPELMLQSETPRWMTSTVGREQTPKVTSSADSPGRPTLFRVWSSDAQLDPETRPGFLTRAQVSLTPAAQRAVAAFDPVTQSTAAGCTPKGMPILMGQPFPIEFVDEGAVILLRLEEYDAVRTIHMGAEPATAPEPSLLGHSIGRWDGTDLVVDTDRLDSPYFNSRGIPLGKSARTHERFAVSADGRRLAYELTVTDPDTFSEPARATRAWLARDGERLMPYDCKDAARD